VIVFRDGKIEADRINERPRRGPAGAGAPGAPDPGAAEAHA
jgi:hypothetical protein